MVEAKPYVSEKVFDVEHGDRKGSRCTVPVAFFSTHSCVGSLAQ